MTRRTLLHAADRVFRIAIALAPPSAAHAARGCVIQTAKLIAGHGAMGEWREPGQDDPDAPTSSIWIPGWRMAPVLGYPAGRTPAGGRARVRRGGAGRHGPAQAARARSDAAARSVRRPYSGITLSDEGGPGERTRTRRSGASPGLPTGLPCRTRIGRSVCDGVWTNSQPYDRHDHLSLSHPGVWSPRRENGRGAGRGGLGFAARTIQVSFFRTERR